MHLGPELHVPVRRVRAPIGGPPAGKIVASFQAHTEHAQDAYSFVEGHAGAGVTAATLNLSDGSHVQTTVQNGWLVAWWPGSADVTSAQVTTASGTTTQQFATQPAAHCPQPTAGQRHAQGRGLRLPAVRG